MPTHQSLGGASDEQLLLRMVTTHSERYGQDYWVWAPADFDLKNAALRSKALQEHADLFRDCPTLTGVFVAGGDPVRVEARESCKEYLLSTIISSPNSVSLAVSGLRKRFPSAAFASVPFEAIVYVSY